MAEESCDVGSRGEGLGAQRGVGLGAVGTRWAERDRDGSAGSTEARDPADGRPPPSVGGGERPPPPLLRPAGGVGVRVRATGTMRAAASDGRRAKRSSSSITPRTSVCASAARLVAPSAARRLCCEPARPRCARPPTGPRQACEAAAAELHPSRTLRSVTRASAALDSSSSWPGASPAGGGIFGSSGGWGGGGCPQVWRDPPVTVKETCLSLLASRLYDTCGAGGMGGSTCGEGAKRCKRGVFLCLANQWSVVL